MLFQACMTLFLIAGQKKYIYIFSLSVFLFIQWNSVASSFIQCNFSIY